MPWWRGSRPNSTCGRRWGPEGPSDPLPSLTNICSSHPSSACELFSRSPKTSLAIRPRLSRTPTVGRCASSVSAVPDRCRRARCTASAPSAQRPVALRATGSAEQLHRRPVVLLPASSVDPVCRPADGRGVRARSSDGDCWTMHGSDAAAGPRPQPSRPTNGAMNPDGSPDGDPEPELATAISTAMNVPSPSTTQITARTSTCGLARKKRISGCTGVILAGAARMLG
jgi:hypothetical protein